MAYASLHGPSNNAKPNQTEPIMTYSKQVINYIQHGMNLEDIITELEIMGDDADFSGMSDNDIEQRLIDNLAETNGWEKFYKTYGLVG